MHSPFWFLRGGRVQQTPALLECVNPKHASLSWGFILELCLSNRIEKHMGQALCLSVSEELNGKAGPPNKVWCSMSLSQAPYHQHSQSLRCPSARHSTTSTARISLCPSARHPTTSTASLCDVLQPGTLPPAQPGSPYVPQQALYHHQHTYMYCIRLGAELGVELGAGIRV